MNESRLDVRAGSIGAALVLSAEIPAEVPEGLVAGPSDSRAAAGAASVVLGDWPCRDRTEWRPERSADFTGGRRERPNPRVQSSRVRERLSVTESAVGVSCHLYFMMIFAAVRESCLGHSSECLCVTLDRPGGATWPRPFVQLAPRSHRFALSEDHGRWLR